MSDEPFFGCTISDYNHFVQHFIIRMQNHFYNRLNINLLRLQSNERNHQSSRRTDAIVQ